METIAQDLIAIIDRLEPELLRVSPADAAEVPAHGKWSKIEILGHLIDSAANNHQKFVRAMLANKSVEMDGYEQDAWVASQQYVRRDWHSVIALWAAYNRHLAHLIRQVDPAKLDNTLFISGKGPFILSFVMSDYVEHLKHHLIQILPGAGLSSNFSMTAYA